MGEKLKEESAEDSFSFAGSLTGKPPAAPMQHGLVLHSAGGRFAIRQDEWKLVDGRGAGGMRYGKEDPDVRPAPGEPLVELYNLAKDPGEKENLAASRPDVAGRLTELLRKYQAEGRSRPRAESA
jgi:arylsulfatase A-like enzyme